MANFVRAPIETVKIKDRVRENIPVNIEQVTGLHRTIEYIAKDGYWHMSIPVIHFLGTSIKWYFKEEDERNKVYDEFLKNVITVGG